MKIRTNFSLQTLNSLNVPANTPEIFFPTNLEELSELPQSKTAKSYILGEGTNTLFCEKSAPVIIKPSIVGIEVSENEAFFLISAACAENWHDFVLFCVNNGMYGLENLALIPGSVGAAPVQNIGAYGVEVGDFIERVTWFDFASQKLSDFSKTDCQFGYRNSLFKQALSGRGIITHVHFALPKAWQAVDSYQGLNEIDSPITPQAIMAKVMQLRQVKLPEPKQLPNAGSFFKNPVVTADFFNKLQKKYPSMPFYKQTNGAIKLAAGWLIEQAGLKGFREAGVGVHEKQALVLINYEGRTGQEVVDFACFIQDKVRSKFNINLDPEVRFIGSDGLTDITSLGIKK